MYKAFASLVKFTHKYFILFDVLINGTVSLTFSYCSLLACRNAADFSVLILYPKTLMNLFISSNNFCVIFRVFYT